MSVHLPTCVRVCKSVFVCAFLCVFVYVRIFMCAYEIGFFFCVCVLFTVTISTFCA